jgi:HK97 family phage major capsid protein
MYYGLAEAYAPRATWACRRATTASIMVLKNATTNQYLLVPNLAAGQPPTILGCPLVEMPDIPAWADETACLLFGDFRAAYTIVDRIDIQIQRLIEKYAELGEIGFLARKRVGGLLVLPEAMRVLYGETS